MASCTSSRLPGKDGHGVASGTLRYLHERRSQRTYVAPGSQTTALEGVLNPDFLALGLGGTNLMAMLYAVAMGKRAVGVEMRGDPSLGVHWNIREDLFHQLGLIDQMMLERYDETEIPRRDNGKIFSLADCFFCSETKSGDVVPDEVIDGFDSEQHIVGTIQHVEYIDDRYKSGVPSRTVTELPPPPAPISADPLKIRSDLKDVLDGPSMFQASALSIQLLLRRYLEKVEEMDLAAGRYPRVRLFTQHRVVEKEGFGFVRQEDGRLQVRIEEVIEMDFKGKTIRLRSPGSDIIDIGVPELFSIAQGAHSSDAARLGFSQQDVEVDHMDGRGPVVAQADYIAGLFELLVDGRLRRRIASHFDEDGNEYWIRQIAVGHENDPEVAWVLVQVPDHMSFDPIEAGLVAPNTCESSAEYFAAYQILLQDFYIEQAALVLGMPIHELKKVEQVYGPKIFSLVERMGEDARVAPNGVIAGDSFGNGHFMTSGGAMTGMIGHSFRFLEHWQRRVEGIDMDFSIRLLANRIRSDTEAWLAVSAKEFTEAIPINFGAELGAQIAAASGISPDTRSHNVTMARQHRHGLIPLDPSDWRRLFLKNGRVLSCPLPPLSPDHPDLAQWMEANPTVNVTDMTAEPNVAEPNPADVMMGAAQMRSHTPVLKSEIEALEEEIEQLKLQHQKEMYEAMTGLPFEGSIVSERPLLHEPRPSYTSVHSSISNHSDSGYDTAEKRARKLERFNIKMDLIRQREDIHRQIQSLSVDSPISQHVDSDPLFPPPAPADLVAKLLRNRKPGAELTVPRIVSSKPGYTANPNVSMRRLSDSAGSVSGPWLSPRRPSSSMSYTSQSTAISNGSRAPPSRPSSSMSHHSRSMSATPRNPPFIRSPSPRMELKGPLITMTMDHHMHDDQDMQFQTSSRRASQQGDVSERFNEFMGAVMDIYQKQYEAERV